MDHGSPEDSERVFKEVVWSQILPHFTEMGRLEFDLLIERLTRFIYTHRTRTISVKKTKGKILEKAILLFNERGIPNVKLQHIADACNISVGNLAYHFKFKEDLITHCG